MLTDANFEELRLKGYTTISDMLSREECDHAIGQYREWLSQFKDNEWPCVVNNSLIQGYNTGNMEPTWYVRLKSKRVFAQLWKTEKLLASVDAIAIGRPPEDGAEPFYTEDNHWFHVDQGSSRQGLHAYQGAVYLEAADEDDWTLHVVEGSHRHLEEFYEEYPTAATISDLKQNFYRFNDDEMIFFLKRGCHIKRVPVCKGGMVLWDSRLIHANAHPLEGRKNPGRWRFCVFVSMTPAIWASDEDLKEKQEVYENAFMTTHWSSQQIIYFSTDTPILSAYDVKYPKELPDIAKTREGQLLSGAVPYDFRDGEPNGDEYMPKWKDGYKKDLLTLNPTAVAGGLVCFAAVAAALGYAMLKYKNN